MTREDLKRCKYSKEYIDSRIEFVEEYSTTINKLTTTISDMPSTPQQQKDMMAERLATLLDYAIEIMDDIARLNKLRKEAEEQINQIEEPYATILYKAYIQGKTFVKIADEMSYSYTHICREHGKALQKYDIICKSEEKS